MVFEKEVFLRCSKIFHKDCLYVKMNETAFSFSKNKQTKSQLIRILLTIEPLTQVYKGQSISQNQGNPPLPHLQKTRQVMKSYDGADTQTCHTHRRISLTPTYSRPSSTFSKMITALKEKLMRKEKMQRSEGLLCCWQSIKLCKINAISSNPQKPFQLNNTFKFTKPKV